MGESEKNDIVEAVINGLQQKGMVVTTAEIADEGLRLMQARTRLMRRNHLTPYEISKFELIGKISMPTIRNMVKDGRIMQHEHFTDNSGKLYITRECVKRLTD